MEAVAFAGHQKLDNLILIYDANDVTLDAMAAKTQSENAALRFKAIGWDVQTIDGHDMAAFLKAFNKAKKTKSGKPQLIVARTLIAKSIPEVQGTAKGHGEGGAKFFTRRTSAVLSAASRPTTASRGGAMRYASGEPSGRPDSLAR